MAKRSLKNLAKTIKESEGSNADNSLVIDVTQTPLFSTVQEIKEIEEAAKVKGVKKMSNIYWLDPNELLPYPDEKIRLPLHSGLRKEQLKETIVKDGVLDPAIVWEIDGKRIILAGHNRVEICKEENLDIPCIIRNDLNDKAAERIVIVTNLMNRQHKDIVPGVMSELLTRLIDQYSDLSTKKEVYDIIDKEYALNARAVQRYIQISKMNENLKEYLDAGVITFDGACKLASASRSNQELLANFIKNNNIKKISGAQVAKIVIRVRTDWDDDYLSRALGLINEESSKSKKTLTIKMKDIERYTVGKEITAKTVSNMFQTDYRIREQFEAHNVEYSDDIVIKAIEAYLGK